MYIGESKMKISTRVQQHQKSAFNGITQSSGICEHAINTDHQIEWNKCTTLKVEAGYFNRKVREALEIQKHNSFTQGCNQDEGNYVDHKFWLPMIKEIEKKEIRTNNWRQSQSTAITTEIPTDDLISDDGRI